MNITLTNRETIKVINVLAELEEKILPVELSYAASKNLEGITREIYKPYEKELKKLQEKYSEKDDEGNCKKSENGGYLLADPEGFTEAAEELLEIENTFDCHEVTKEMLEKCMEGERYTPLKAKEVAIFAKFIKD